MTLQYITLHYIILHRTKVDEVRIALASMAFSILRPPEVLQGAEASTLGPWLHGAKTPQKHALRLHVARWPLRYMFHVQNRMEMHALALRPYRAFCF